MHWKIRRDPYLGPLCERRGEAAVWAAGFFLDEATEHEPLDDTDWLCTPLPKRPASGARPVVLLSTGGFCPVHPGHLEMMERARQAAERAGFGVMGGYLSPGHDAYLRMKCGDQAIPIGERLLQCVRATADSEWLSVDPWEAMHRRVAVNYTDVVARLEAYLRRHVDPTVEVIYVCGGDNARFASAFRDKGRCIVVGRPGAEPEFERWRAELDAAPHLQFVEGGRTFSSRDLRQGPFLARPRPRLVVRLEDARAVRTLGLTNYAQFQAELLALLSRHAEVRSMVLTEPTSAGSVISLDAMLPAEHNIALSRLFALGGYETRGHVPRPGAAPFPEQFARLPAGTYSLRDDDRVTGGTLSALRSLLPARVGLSQVSFAVDHADDEDVVDARDFLLGADDGGLVLELPAGGVGRAPYLLPYVDPAARASITASHRFSIDVWRLNARLFAGTALRVEHLPAPTRATFSFLGSMPLDALCAWHLERLEASAPPED
jgi:nicotinic acid mononucleotide adenylyltransferase